MAVNPQLTADQESIENFEATLVINENATNDNSSNENSPLTQSLNSSTVLVSNEQGGAGDRDSASSSISSEGLSNIAAAVAAGGGGVGSNKFSENYEATLERREATKEVVSRKVVGIDDDDDEEGRRSSNKALILNVTIDVAVAGLYLWFLFKRPRAESRKLGFNALGLSLFYGVHWYVYKKYFAASRQ